MAARFRLGFAPAVEAEGWNFLGSRFSGEMLAAAIDAGLLVKKEKGGTYDRFRDRIVFPIFTPAGQVCGFSGRILGDGQPKYLNSPESPIYTKSRLLFGLYQAKEAIRKSDRAVLVEGNFDMISLFAAGCENVVAPLGTALTREQLRLLKKFTSNAVLLFDGDAAGRRAAARATPLFFREGMSGRVALLPDGCDPDSYVRQFGVEALRGLLEEAKELPEFTVERLVEEHGLTFDGKIKIVEELKPLLAATGSRVKRELFLRHFEQQLGMENGGLAALEEEIRRSPQQGRAAETPPSGGPPAFGHESGAAAGRLLPQAERMSRQQQQVTASLLLNPDWYPRLAEAGVQRFLRGTPGEVIFLRLGELLRENAFAEPEELLNVLAEGDERNFAADILLNPPQPAEEGGECRDAELAEVLNTLGVVQEKENLHSLNEQ
ncbi:DNA primase, partial [bacterium DOLJORAL78_65_58]